MSEKIYYCPITNIDYSEASLRNFSGLSLFQRTKFDFKRSLEKAISGDYKEIFFPYNSCYHSEFINFSNLAKEQKLEPVWQVHSKQLVDKDLLSKIKENVQIVEITLAHYNLQLENLIKDLILSGKEVRFSIHIDSYINIAHLVGSINPEVCTKIQLIYSFAKCNNRERIIRDLESLKRKKIRFTAVQGRSVYDPFIGDTFEIERLATPMYDNREDEVKPIVSVIIPSYNGIESIKMCLSHLKAQSLSREEYEVIFIDDGSDDGTLQEFSQLFKSGWFRDMQICFLSFPRVIPRQMGDSQFRAGQARNLGVKFSRAEILSFLDCDMLVDINYLSDIAELMKHKKFVQHPRYHLKKEACRKTSYAELVQEEDTYKRHNSYWEDFYIKAKNWNKMEDSWRYVSSNSLTVSKELFIATGGFRNSYISYGFEDSELGFQIYKKGVEFYLHHKPTYHYLPNKRKTEFFGHKRIKKNLLKRSASMFLHNTLTEGETGFLKVYT